MSRIRAALQCDAQMLTPAAADAQVQAGVIRCGRWRINAGSVMLMEIPGLNDDAEGNPGMAWVVIDLAGIELPKTMAAIASHDSARIVGVWSNLTVADSGLDADLDVLAPADPTEAVALADAIRTRAMIRAGVPLQCSVGMLATYERVEEPTTVNGKEIAPDEDDELPLYIARNGDPIEGSMTLRGADSRTGQIAASAHTHHRSKDPTMAAADLKLMLAKHSKHKALVADLVAEGKSEAEIGEAVHAEQLTAAAAEVTRLQAENATLKASKVKPADQAAAGSTPEAQLKAGEVGGGGDPDAPKTWGEARQRLVADGSKLKGMALNAEVRRRFPTLKATDHDYAARGMSTGA